MFTPFSLLAPELSNPDQNNVFGYLFTWPRCHKTSMISLFTHVMFSVSPRIRYVPCSLQFLSLDLDLATEHSHQISINTRKSTTGGPLPSPPFLPDSLHDQPHCPGHCWGCKLQRNKLWCSPDMCCCSSFTGPTWHKAGQPGYLEPRKRGKSIFDDHSEDLGGTLRTRGKNSPLMFPEGSHLSAIQKPSCMRKKPLHTE